MSVIIPNLTLPSSCVECTFFQNSDSYCVLKCYVPYRIDEYGEVECEKTRMKNCPLKSGDGLILEIENIQQWNAEEKAFKAACLSTIKEYCNVSKIYT